MSSVSLKEKRLFELADLEWKAAAEMLAFLAKVDRRNLWRDLGYETMVEYCVDKLGMCEDMAEANLEVARTARAFPTLFKAIATGHLQVAAVRLIAPHLTRQNLNELVAAVAHRPASEIKAMLAEWFPGSAA
jgi:hypothetical protein